MSGHERGAPGLLVQFLAWVDMRSRTYGETMDAWRTSCPRLSIWEDAVSEGFVSLEAGEASQRGTRVTLTQAGRIHLAAEATPRLERVLVG